MKNKTTALKTKKTTKKSGKNVPQFSLKNCWEVRCGINLQTGNGEEFEKLFSFLFVGSYEAADAYITKHSKVILNQVRQAAAESTRYADIDIEDFDVSCINLEWYYKDLNASASDLHRTIEAAKAAGA